MIIPKKYRNHTISNPFFSNAGVIWGSLNPYYIILDLYLSLEKPNKIHLLNPLIDEPLFKHTATNINHDKNR